MGRVASGDQFISKNHIPYVIIRAISDMAVGTAEGDYPTFEKQAITHSVNLMRELLPMI